MLPKCLLPQQQTQGDGLGSKIDLGEFRGKLLVLTLGISSVIHREGVVVSVYGSPDGLEWNTRPLASFPRKDYCGLYYTLLNLVRFPNIRYLRVSWIVTHASAAKAAPPFEFFLFAEVSGSRVSAALAACAA